MLNRWLSRTLLAAVVFGPAFASSSEPARKDRHALLIGVTFYENLPKVKHLAGPANDVLLMRQLLIERFQFSPEQITVLSEQHGRERGKEFYPTRANIEREFKRLARLAKAGEQVVIHMGGHGSQQPENKNSTDPEPDGLDEIFLPRDVGAWDASKGSVANAIIDNEISAWLKAIRDTKASVWITFDSCHSGTMIRGGDASEKARDLDPVNDLRIPKQAMQEATVFAAKRPGQERSQGRFVPAFKLAQEAGIVAIYACQPNELTYERELPPNNSERKVYGLLTYSLCRILTEATIKADEPITYNELARRIYGHYVQSGRASPTPFIEGVDRDRQVLGDKVWPGRSSIQLQEDDGRYRINAGALHGLTEGTILEIVPVGTTKRLGHVRVTELRAHTANVEPCAYGNMALVKSLPDGAVGKVVFVDVGDQQLRVAIDPRDAEGMAIPSTTFVNLEKLLKGLVGPQSLVRLTDKMNQADWLIRVHGKNVALVRGSGADTAFGPVPIDAKLGDWLKNTLESIARAESLKRLAAGGDLGGGSEGIRLDMKLTRRKDASDKAGSLPITWPAPDVLAYDGDQLVVKFINKGRSPVDMTLLYIDSGFGIDSLYPSGGELNRLRPGDTETVVLGMNSQTAGLEQLVVIAVKSKGQPIDFSQLTQPTLERALQKAGTRGEELKQTFDTPLGKLLKRGMYGIGDTRGVSAVDNADYSLFTVPFNVRPQKRSALNAK